MLKWLFRQKRRKGFTLIELIVVLVILAILAAAVVPQIMGYVDEARYAAQYAKVRTLAVATKAALVELEADGVMGEANRVHYITWPAYPLEGIGDKEFEEKLLPNLSDDFQEDIGEDRIRIYYMADMQTLLIYYYLTGDFKSGGKYILYRDAPEASPSITVQ